MALLPFNRIGNINRLDRNTINGYIREAETSMNHNGPVPLMINTICLLFYYEFDQFGICGRYMTIKQAGTAVTINDKDRNGCSCYGTMDIINNQHFKAFLYQWTFKYERGEDYDKAENLFHKNSDDPYSALAIGITDDAHDVNIDHSNVHWFEAKYNFHVALSEYGDMYRTKFLRSESCKTEKYSQDTFKELGKGTSTWLWPGDEIIICLDMKEKMMEYRIHRECPEMFASYSVTKIAVKFPSNNTKYRIAVFDKGIGTTVRMIKFNKVPWKPATDKEGIYDRIQKIQSEEQSLEHTNS